MLKNRNKSSEQVSVWPIGRTLLSGLAGLFLTALFTFGVAVLLHREVLPLTFCNWLGPVIIGAASLFTAWFAARHNGKKLLCGLLASGVYGLALVICGMLLFSSPMVPGRMLLSAGALFFGMLGGVVLSAMAE